MRARPIGLLIATATLHAGQVPAREAADKAAFEKVCGTCHASSMISEIRTEPEWKETVEHMVSIGANGTEEELEAVMRTLLRTQTKVNVNKAGAAELPLVLGISDATARAVVNYRAAHGNFKTLADLKKVPGIDAAKLEARKDRVVF